MSLKQIPAPTKGWNNRDNMSSLRPDEAVKLVNIVPEYGYCRTRGGHIEYYVTDQIDRFKTLVVYKSGSSDVLIAAGRGLLLDVDRRRVLKSRMSSDIYQTMMFKQKLIMCNGADVPQVYSDGTETVDLNAELHDTDGEIENLSIRKIIGCVSYQGRAFYYLDREQRIFFADTAGAYQGTLKEFDLSTQVSNGSRIVSLFTYGQDTGGGARDYLVIMFNTGECLMYEGTDPAQANRWQLVQRPRIGKLISRRSVCKVGNDILLTTNEGLVNFSAAITDTTAIDQRHVGSKIADSFKRNASVHEFKQGWEINYFPEFSFIIANIPRGSSGQKFKQFVFNTTVNGWCKFKDLNAYTWVVHKNKLLFASYDGNIYQAETNASDNGDFIYAEAIGAFDYMGTPYHKKALGVGIISSVGSCDNIAMSVMSDFDTTSNVDYPFIEDSGPQVALIGKAILGTDYIKYAPPTVVDPPLIGSARVGDDKMGQDVAREQPKRITVERLPTESYYWGYDKEGQTLAINFKITTKSEIQIYSSKLKFKTNTGKK